MLRNNMVSITDFRKCVKFKMNLPLLLFWKKSLPMYTMKSADAVRKFAKLKPHARRFNLTSSSPI